MNFELDSISKWAINWLVDFHLRKTEFFLVSKMVNQIAHPPLIMHKTVFADSFCHKHLGITFSITCDWTEHISRISKNECKTQLESIHNEAARIVRGATKLCSIKQL